jgi:hypothetical protein
MFALFFMLAAQAAASAPDAAPTPAPAPARRVCRQEPGSVSIVCRAAPRQQQQLGYRLPRYGPGAPAAQSSHGDGVKVGAQASNKGRRSRSMATVGIPF